MIKLLFDAALLFSLVIALIKLVSVFTM